MDPWIEGAKVIEAVSDGGSMTGRDCYATWHSTENDPHTTTAANIAHYLNTTRNCVHVVWNPVTGETVVTIPPHRAGRGLENPAGGVETNRQGSVNIQIEVVARASSPFTDGPMKGREAIIRKLRHLGVPDVWPAGPPLPASKAYGPNPTRSVAKWSGSGGHFSHSEVPENVHADPGDIDVNALLKGGKPVKSSGAKKHANHQDEPATPNFHREDGDGIYEPGEEGPGIKTLQLLLQRKGFLEKVDGFFGGETEAAVKAFQRSKSLKVTGEADAKVQRLLGLTHVKEDGPSLKVDGDLGSLTWKAIQKACDLKGSEVDGDPGPVTLKALQKHLKVPSTGKINKATKVAVQKSLGLKQSGIWNAATVSAWQRALNKGEF